MRVYHRSAMSCVFIVDDDDSELARYGARCYVLMICSLLVIHMRNLRDGFDNIGLKVNLRKNKVMVSCGIKK